MIRLRSTLSVIAPYAIAATIFLFAPRLSPVFPAVWWQRGLLVFASIAAARFFDPREFGRSKRFVAFLATISAAIFVFSTFFYAPAGDPTQGFRFGWNTEYDIKGWQLTKLAKVYKDDTFVDPRDDKVIEELGGVPNVFRPVGLYFNRTVNLFAFCVAFYGISCLFASPTGFQGSLSQFRTVAKRARETVWYVEACTDDGTVVAAGSAVAIRLKRDTADSRLYLLTCAHVLRNKSTIDGIKGFGPILSQFNVWAPQSSYENEKKSARIVQEACQLDRNDVPVEERGNAIEDWALLELLDEDDAKFSDLYWSNVSNRDEVVTIWGYPGGRQSFRKTVNPTYSPQDIRIRDTVETDGNLGLVGSETAEGMSGGAVMDISGNLVGLHRARFDQALQLHGISALKLREILSQAGYQ